MRPEYIEFPLTEHKIKQLKHSLLRLAPDEKTHGALLDWFDSHVIRFNQELTIDKCFLEKSILKKDNIVEFLEREKHYMTREIAEKVAEKIIFFEYRRGIIVERIRATLVGIRL